MPKIRNMTARVITVLPGDHVIPSGVTATVPSEDWGQAVRSPVIQAMLDEGMLKEVGGQSAMEPTNGGGERGAVSGAPAPLREPAVPPSAGEDAPLGPDGSLAGKAADVDPLAEAPGTQSEADLNTGEAQRQAEEEAAKKEAEAQKQAAEAAAKGKK